MRVGAAVFIAACRPSRLRLRIQRVGVNGNRGGNRRNLNGALTALFRKQLQSWLACGVNHGHRILSSKVVLSQVSERRPGAPMLVLLDEANGMVSTGQVARVRARTCTPLAIHSGRGVFVGAMADAVAAGDEDHAGGSDAGHEQRVVIRAADHSSGSSGHPARADASTALTIVRRRMRRAGRR